MDFGDVIKELKANPTERFARKGWNGKGMYIFLTEGHIVPKGDWKGEPLKGIEGDVKICPHIDMKAADGTLVIGWLASQTDMLADDWEECP